MSPRKRQILLRGIIQDELARAVLVFCVGVLAILWVDPPPQLRWSDLVEPIVRWQDYMGSVAGVPGAPAVRSVPNSIARPVFANTESFSLHSQVPLETATVVVRTSEALRAKNHVQASSTSLSGTKPDLVTGSSRVPVDSPENVMPKDAASYTLAGGQLTLTMDQLVALPGATRPLEAPIPDSGTSVASISDTDAVRQAIQEYKKAYETLDVHATARIWPSVNRRALTRAFASLRSQGLTFAHCELDLRQGAATARCNGAIQFVPKVGSSVPLTSQQEWLFRMDKSAADWRIRNVTAYQASSAPSGRQSRTH